MIPGAIKPQVGAGAEYQLIDKKDGHNIDMTMAVVGKETVNGNDGYWWETRMNPAGQGEVAMKMLLVVANGTSEIKRMIMQPAGHPAMEMPAGMMHMDAPKVQTDASSAADSADRGQLIGTETVTVPAGTFVCQHYRKDESDGPLDMWVSSSVNLYGMVKMTSAKADMILEKVLSNETSHIKGEPQKMPGMPKMGLPHF
jgi:hypothetical protein